MNRRTVGLVIAAALALAACGGDGEAPDLTPIHEDLPLFPGGVVDLEGGPPAGMIVGTAELFKNDVRYFISGTGLTREIVLGFFQQEMPKRDWQSDEPANSRSEEFRGYCDAQFISCLAFTKDGVRAIISSPIVLGLNPVAPVGQNYHVHLEKA